ncbi:MAG: hypothetical protein HC767_08830, partial [Akkermansiaceae bacterium]|nr:hypothetical protein [Akkermansiaceae bacterium]
MHSPPPLPATDFQPFKKLIEMALNSFIALFLASSALSLIDASLIYFAKSHAFTGIVVRS